MLNTKPQGERARRMPLKADVLLMREGEAWACSAIDLSATGVSVERPDAFAGAEDDHVRVEVLLSANRTMSLVGRIARLGDDHIAVVFTRVPAESEANLWGLLGEYADWVEGFE